jgi:hypothetical protein
MLDYTPRTLRFDKPGVDWMVDHTPELRDGIWPGDMPYDKVEIRGKQYSCRAPNENISLILAELSRRVMRCGTDGLLVEQRMLGKSEEEIARERYLKVNYIENCVSKVLWYCASGNYPMWWTKRDNEGNIKRQGLSYEDWKRRQFYRRQG